MAADNVTETVSERPIADPTTSIPQRAWIGARYDMPSVNGPDDQPWHGFGPDGPDRPVIERLRDVVAAIPDRIAVDDGTTRLTFRQLWQVIGRLGNAVAAAAPTARHAAPVAVMLSDDSFYVAAMFAGLASARPAVLLDRHAPVGRNAAILRDSGAATVILRAADIRDPALPAGIVPIVLESALLDAADHFVPPQPGLSADLPAFILYTSGSTGVPKGVAVSQHGWAQLMRLRTAHMRWAVGDRSLRLGPLATSWGINATGGMLLAGATTYIADLPRLGFGGVLDLIARCEITVLKAGPSLVKALVRMPDAAAALAGLRLLAAGGESLLRADLAEIQAALPAGCVITHCLVSTETYVAECTVTVTRGGEPHRVPSGYIGPGYEVALIDEDGQPSAAGEEGEIWVRSRFTALGDWSGGQVEPTRFPPDPADPARRIYRTGDVARMDADGCITVLGRRDRMLKINGARVEPAEIEAAIRRQPAVLDCMVLPWVPREQPDARPRLVAFVLPRAPVAADDLAGHLLTILRGELPGFLVPRRIEVRAIFPLLPGGKIDALALLASLAPAPDAPVAQAVAPIADATRELVRDIWRQSLGDAAPLDRSFADAGGDSLQMLQFVFRLEKALGVDLPLEAFDMAATVDDIARIAAAGSARPASHPDMGEAPLFLLPGVAFGDPALAAFCAGLTLGRPVIVLHWPEWRVLCRDGFAAGNLLADLARRVHDIAPHGPIHLVGYSIGGVVAHALARVLSEAGREIAFLGLLDTNADLRAPVPAVSVRLLRDVAREIGLVDRGRPRKQLSLRHRLARFTARLLTSPRGQVLLRLARDRRWWERPGAWNALLGHRLNRDMLHRVLLTAAQEGQLLAPLAAIPTVLFRAAQRPAAADLGWSGLCADFTIVGVRGDHRSMLGSLPEADLATKLRAAIAHATRACLSGAKSG